MSKEGKVYRLDKLPEQARVPEHAKPGNGVVVTVIHEGQEESQCMILRTTFFMSEYTVGSRIIVPNEDIEEATPLEAPE